MYRIKLPQGDHGQHLVAYEWFKKHYPTFKCKRVSVIAKNEATRAAIADDSYALTLPNLQKLISDARSFLSELCSSQLPPEQLEGECARLLHTSPISAENLYENYLKPFYSN